jgi:malonate transporter
MVQGVRGRNDSDSSKCGTPDSRRPAIGITELFHMSHDDIRDITLLSAIPGGFFGIVFGKSFNSTPETASSALIASYCVAAFSMTGWMLVITKYL